MGIKLLFVYSYVIVCLTDCIEFVMYGLSSFAHRIIDLMALSNSLMV